MTELRTWQDWDRMRFNDVAILDPDGFRYPGITNETLFDKEEFLRRQQECTVRPLVHSMMKSSDYAEGYWEGGDGSEYHGYGDDPGWVGILQVLEHYARGGSFLDIGCSKGFMVWHAKEFGYDAYGCDISEYAVQMAPVTIANRITRENVTDLPYSTGWFDVVHTGEFWEHMTLDEFERAMDEALRVLKPGGVFVNRIGIVVPENHPFRQPTLEDHSAHHTHFNVKTREEWIEYFKGRGLIRMEDMEAELDERFANRDWVMRFFCYRKPLPDPELDRYYASEQDPA